MAILISFYFIMVARAVKIKMLKVTTKTCTVLNMTHKLDGARNVAVNEWKKLLHISRKQVCPMWVHMRIMISFNQQTADRVVVILLLDATVVLFVGHIGFM